MIIKVQLSLMSSDGLVRMLAYDKERSFTYEAVADDDVLDLMCGRPKAYFEAKINKDKLLEIGEEVEEQDW
jgi:hypothetical protein